MFHVNLWLFAFLLLSLLIIAIEKDGMANVSECFGVSLLYFCFSLWVIYTSIFLLVGISISLRLAGITLGFLVMKQSFSSVKNSFTHRNNLFQNRKK
ncbi:hypothetical protein FI615_002207 [Enterococcus faecium]|nr:hypothetical protein [Enterococcus faecium]EMF0115987.1 hypothetical protein [Enterococcus hirae]